MTDHTAAAAAHDEVVPDLKNTKNRVDLLLGTLLAVNDPSRRPSCSNPAPVKPKVANRRLVSDELEDTRRRVDRLIRKLSNPDRRNRFSFVSDTTSTIPAATPTPATALVPRQESLSIVDPLNFLEDDVPPQELKLSEIPDVPPTAERYNSDAAKQLIAERAQQERMKRNHKRKSSPVPQSILVPTATQDDDDETHRKRHKSGGETSVVSV